MRRERRLRDFRQDRRLVEVVRSESERGEYRFGVAVLRNEISRRLRNDIGCENGGKEHWDSRDESKCPPTKTWKDSIPIEIFPEHDPTHEPDIDCTDHPEAVSKKRVMARLRRFSTEDTWQ
jgi:hypothetical protein